MVDNLTHWRTSHVQIIQDIFIHLNALTQATLCYNLTMFCLV